MDEIDPKGMPPHPFHRLKAQGIKPCRELPIPHRRPQKGARQIEQEIGKEGVIIRRVKILGQDSNNDGRIIGPFCPAAGNDRQPEAKEGNSGYHRHPPFFAGKQPVKEHGEAEHMQNAKPDLQTAHPDSREQDPGYQGNHQRPAADDQPPPQNAAGKGGADAADHQK